MRWIPHALLALAVLAMACPDCTAGDTEDTGQRLTRLLAAYDQRGGGNTIPIEQAILELESAGRVAALLPHMDHPRFGETVAWAVCLAAEPGDVEKVLAAMAAWSPARKAAVALYVARLPGEAPDAFLGRIGVDAVTPVAQRRALMAARLVRGEEKAKAVVKTGLASSELPHVVDALLTLAETRDAKFLGRVAALTTDPRKLPEPVLSLFKTVRREKLASGGVRVTKTSPSLQTVGELALEVGNRLVLPTTPEYIAWWYEWEKSPRFGFGDAGRLRLEQWVRAAADGGKRGLAPLSAAVTAALGWLQGRGSERPPGGVFVKGWQMKGKSWAFEFAIEGRSANVRVDRKLAVSELPKEKRSGQ